MFIHSINNCYNNQKNRTSNKINNTNFQGTLKNPIKFSNSLSRRIVDLKACEGLLVGPKAQNKALLSQFIKQNPQFITGAQVVDIMQAPDLDFSYYFYKTTNDGTLSILTDATNLTALSDDDGNVVVTDSYGYATITKDRPWYLTTIKDDFSFHPTIKDYFSDDLPELMREMRTKRRYTTEDEDDDKTNNVTKNVETVIDNLFKDEKTNATGDNELKGFAKVGGQDKAIKILEKEIIFPLKFPGLFPGVKPEVGYILYGPPGVGKSLLAEALSEEWKSTFVSINANELTNKYIGQSESNWRELFKKLEKTQPALLFIDEGDALMRKRGGTDTHGDKMLNQFLQLVSQTKQKGSKIRILMATNVKLETLDPAITRPGRFGRHIEMLPPQNLDDMTKIFDIHTKKSKLANDIDKIKICKALLEKKYTGSGVESLVGLANIKALERLNLFEKMRKNAVEFEDYKNFCITTEDFYEAMKEINNIESPKIGYQK